MTPIPFRRDAMRDALAAPGVFDIVIVGGGATGLGCAVDAAARGYRTALVERVDFGAGTSSRSTKLVHGGVRYLARGDVRLVREALRERGRLLANAPHIAHSRAFAVPAYSWWEKPYYGAGLFAYDRLAASLGIGSTELLSEDEYVERVPTANREGLDGGVLYYDGQFDDARLAVALARTAADLGAVVLNHTAAVGFEKSRSVIDGVRVRDQEDGTERTVRARVVINATGVWADRVRRLDKPSANNMLEPSRGAHIVLDKRFLPGDTAVMVPKTDDGRVLFAIPWLGSTVIGTTDVPVDAPTPEPQPSHDEVDYILEHAGRYLTPAPTRADVRAVWAGLRPLISDPDAEGTAALSREHVVSVSASRLVTVTGGKWTTYRVMAEDAVDHAADTAGLAERPHDTSDLRLRGWLPDALAESGDALAGYGADAAAVHAIADDDPSLAAPVHPRLPSVTGAQIVYAARHEQARTAADALARRTRGLFLDADASAQAADTVAALVAAETGRDDAWADAQAAAVRAIAAGEVV
ncbi:FAD-dependent oxidoreductase [Rubrivirga sp. IMCC45206]|uniref:glycerol-3-phosphate dehydrogenase/oxidase n=1 Tax=Rubrivirga sp. IMCC45206 TaxID=3391614 RepID=UPI00399033B1